MMYEIIQGSRTDTSPAFLIRFKTDAVTYDPLDLSSLTALAICFPNADGTELTLSLSSGLSVVGNPVLGKILISLTAAQTALLALSDNATLELTLTFTGDPIKVQVPSAYTVVSSVC